MTTTPSRTDPAPTRGSAQPVIDITGVRRTFGDGAGATEVLKGVDLQVADGELVVLLGPSGSGKTTLLNILGGIDRATSGTVTVAGESLGDLDDQGLAAFRRHHVGFVFQFFNLIPTLTARENVALIGELVGRADRSEELLAAVGLGDRTDHFPAALSGGEQQRVAVARALAKDPDVLLCDEPTGALDLETGRKVLGVLRQANRERGHTVVVVTHNQVIARMADRVIRLHDGHVAEDERVERPALPEELDW